MSRLPVPILLATLLSALSAPTVAAPQIPSGLAEWEGWVLHGEDVRRCPLQSAPGTVTKSGRTCAWPGELELLVDAHEAKFRQRWRVYAESWLPLPGRDALWPEAVRVDEQPAVVLAAQGAPRIRVAAGEFVVSGTLRYGDRPASLPVPGVVGIVRLVLDGQRIERPERTGSGSETALWLGERAAPAEESRIDLRVHRLLEDAIPARLETRLSLAVAGPAREVVLGPALPEGYTPLAVRSDLPARIDQQGRLTVQVRRGQWQVILLARAPGVVEQFRVPAAAAPWPAVETLSFAPQDSLRVVTLDGVAPVDAAQADVPAEWRSFSAYGVTPEDTLRVTERSRGLDGDAATHIALERELWLDFDHGGWLARDHLQGQLSGRWRLDMVAPYRLESASASGAALLVTSSDPSRSGIELRDRDVDVDALASMAATSGAMPATGWDRTLDHASTTLHLPPGHRLIAAFGVDDSSGDWLGRWTLLDIFVALLVTVATFRLLGAAAAAVALAALVLSFHEPGAPTWLWVNLILAVALVRVLPAGRLRRWARVWRAVSFVLTLIVLVPFAFTQLRLALYPQLMAATSHYPVPIPASSAPESMPSPPAADASAKSGAMMSTEEIQVSAARKVQRYTLAPGTVAQTGPGRPDWRYEDYRLEYAGPVAPTQSMRLLIAPVWVISTLRALGVALSVLLLLLLGSSLSSGAPRPAGPRGRGSLLAASAAGVTLMSAMLLIPTARADTPPPDVLDELKHRLLEPPPCAPDCVELAQAVVAVSDARISIDLEAHAGAAAALALPLLNDKSSVMSVTGAVAKGDDWVMSDARGRSWALIEPGVRRLTLALPPPVEQELRLQFPEVPRRIVVSAPGWSVTGLDGGRLVGDTIVLTRISGPAEQRERQTTSSALAVPPFAVIERDLTLGLDLTMDTTVRRLAPAEGGFTLAVPMLAGESVTESGRAVSIDGRIVRVSFEAGRATDTWTSTLAPVDSMRLTAGVDVPWSEVWRIRASPVWHVTFAGTPEIGDAAAGEARVFHPRPGESLEIVLSRPEPVEGAALALDRVRVEHRFGARAMETTLGYGYRSTQGGRQIVRLPADAVLASLEVDGQAVPVRPEGGDLALPIQPGEHQVAARFARTVAIGLITRTASVELGAPGGNVTTQLELPANRWILWAHGSGVGPAILYWSELLAFLIVAVVVGRHPRSPLRVHEWLLLGLGLSTFSWWVLLVFAGWLFALEWRRQWQSDVWWQFDAVQIALAVLSVVALVALVSAIPNGLLGSPDMRIAGPGSGGTLLEWFDDRIAGALPVKTVFSVSIWWYKAAMLLWALWLSFALVRWVPRAWAALSTGGYWRRRTHPVTTAA